MLAFLGGVLVLIGTIGFIGGIIGLIRPSEKLGLPTRKKAGRAFIGAIIVGTIGAALLPDTPSAADAPSRSTRPATAATAPAGAKEVRAAARQEIIGTWRSMMSAVRPCDDANDRMARTVGAVSNGEASIYDAYSRADEGADACSGAASALSAVKVPDGLSDDVGEEFSKALEMCRGAYTLRETSLETAKEIFDGDSRPSLLSQYRKQAEGAQGGVMGCVAGYMSAAMKAGVDPEQLQLKG